MDIQNPQPDAAEYTSKLEWLRRAVDAGIQSADRGDTFSTEETFARLEAELPEIFRSDQAA